MYLKKMNVKGTAILIMLFGALFQGAQAMVQQWEVEVDAGATCPVAPYHHGHFEVGWQGGVEVRCNPKNDQDLDFGFRLDYTSTRYDLPGERLPGPRPSFSHPTEVDHRAYSLYLTGDYNFCQGKPFNWYVGWGVGGSVLDPKGSNHYADELKWAFLLRIGMEIKSFLRFEINSHIREAHYNNIGATVGVVIGGRPKKPRTE